MVVALICAVLALVIVAMIVAAVLFDLVGHLSPGLRWSMTILGGGLVWGGIDRFRQAPVGIGDLMFLAGVAGVLAFSWAGQWRAALDRLDGRQDGRFGTLRKG